MLVAENRPRNLSWLHAGPLLFGDWGTSRLYVLGLAFYYTGHASVSYLAVMSVLMAAVAWAYTIVCRCFPEGGGVYTAARQLNPMLSVIGATLLLCDFIVTAALSAVEGFKYLGVHDAWVVPCSIGAIIAIGVLNWLGARSAGRFALVIAVAALAASALIGAMCFPLVGEGWKTLTTTAPGLESWWHRWESFVRIVLALSGVEAVANMTGLMKQPVARTAKRTIWPVLIEVVILNLVFGLALNAITNPTSPPTPDYVTHEVVAGLPSEAVPAPVREYRDEAVRELALVAGKRTLGDTTGRVFGVVAGGVFGLLLLSAVNTAVMAMVSVMYALSRDRELPAALAKLNYSGVPWVPLLIAAAASGGLLLIVSDAKALGELYAIGVVGAIAINVVSCALNRSLPISRVERAGMWVLGAIMVAIECTIVVAKPHATLFAAVIITAVLGTRWLLRRLAPPAYEPLPVPEAGWIAEIRAAPAKLDPARPRIMLAARGRDNAEYAVDLARRRGAALFTIYVRTLRVMDVRPGQLPRLEDDPQAQEALGTVALLAARAGVPFFPIYITSPDIADEILDYTVTFNCDTLIMGKSRRTIFSRALAGDVLRKVQEHLPEGISLVTRAAVTPAADHPGPAPAPPPEPDEDVPTPT